MLQLSVSKFRGTFGQQLLNMKFRDYDLSGNKQIVILISQIVTYLHSNNFLVFPSQKVNNYSFVIVNNSYVVIINVLVLCSNLDERSCGKS